MARTHTIRRQSTPPRLANCLVRIRICVRSRPWCWRPIRPRRAPLRGNFRDLPRSAQLHEQLFALGIPGSRFQQWRKRQAYRCRDCLGRFEDSADSHPRASLCRRGSRLHSGPHGRLQDFSNARISRTGFGYPPDIELIGSEAATWRLLAARPVFALRLQTGCNLLARTRARCPAPNAVRARRSAAQHALHWKR